MSGESLEQSGLSSQLTLLRAGGWARDLLRSPPARRRRLLLREQSRISVTKRGVVVYSRPGFGLGGNFIMRLGKRVQIDCPQSERLPQQFKNLTNANHLSCSSQSSSPQEA